MASVKIQHFHIGSLKFMYQEHVGLFTVLYVTCDKLYTHRFCGCVCSTVAKRDEKWNPE